MQSFLIDGYNFLFQLEEQKERSLEKKREAFIKALNQELSSFRPPVSVIFDSAAQPHDYAQNVHLEHLDVLYAPKNKSADEYIIELVETSKNPKVLRVVTSDNGLTLQCQHLGAQTDTIEEFLSLISKKGKKKMSPKPEYNESASEMQRLLIAFEKKLQG